MPEHLLPPVGCAISTTCTGDTESVCSDLVVSSNRCHKGGLYCGQVFNKKSANQTAHPFIPLLLHLSLFRSNPIFPCRLVHIQHHSSSISCRHRCHERVELGRLRILLTIANGYIDEEDGYGTVWYEPAATECGQKLSCSNCALIYTHN